MQSTCVTLMGFREPIGRAEVEGRVRKFKNEKLQIGMKSLEI